MPQVWENLVNKLAGKGMKTAGGKPSGEAYAIATKQLQKKGVLKPGTRELKASKGKSVVKAQPVVTGAPARAQSNPQPILKDVPAQLNAGSMRMKG